MAVNFERMSKIPLDEKESKLVFLFDSFSSVRNLTGIDEKESNEITNFENEKMIN